MRASVLVPPSRVMNVDPLRRSHLRPIFWLATAIPIACATVGDPNPAFDDAVSTSVLQVPASLDIGFDALEKDAVARVGDVVVAHLVAETGEGIVERFIRFELAGRRDDFPDDAVAPEFAIGWKAPEGAKGGADEWWASARDGVKSLVLETDGVIDVDVFDRSGERVASRRVGSRVLMALATTGSTERSAYAIGAEELLHLVLAVPELDALLMAVAKRPPLLSMIRGLTLTLVWPDANGRTLEGGRFEHDSRIEANGRTALVGRVVREPNAVPLMLVSGVVGIEANHPTRPDRRATVTVVGARRGTGACLFSASIGPFPEPDQQGRSRVDPAGIEFSIGGSLEHDSIE